MVTANCEFHGHKLDKLPVLNPGDWFGKTWLVEIGGSYAPLFLIVEADSIQDAIDVLADDEKYGHNINVPPEDMADYDEENAEYAGNDGHLVDLDWLMIHGPEGRKESFPCLYFDENYPDGVKPADWDSDGPQPAEDEAE